MENTNLILDELKDVDFEKIGLKVMNITSHKGRFNCKNIDNEQGAASYIQLGPIVGTFKNIETCHYEIMFVHNEFPFEDKKHKKNYIYIELHFESLETNSKLKNWVNQFSEEHNEEIETFCWGNEECPGLRLKENAYKPSKKNLKYILESLERLVEVTFDDLSYQLKVIADKSNNPFIFTSGTKTNITRDNPKVYKKENTIIVKHRDLQDKLENKLIGQYGETNVTHENPVGNGYKIDLVVRNNNQYILYEIKTAADPIQCVREAIGQLLEYTYYIGFSHIEELRIAGSNDNDEVQNYVKELKKIMKMKISYVKI